MEDTESYNMDDLDDTNSTLVTVRVRVSAAPDGLLSQDEAEVQVAEALDYWSWKSGSGLRMEAIFG